MRDANIVTPNKNEGGGGGRRDCNKYRGIAPIRIAGKLLDQVFLERLQVLEEKDYPDSVVSVPNNQQLTRYSSSENYKETVGNRDSHCASYSLTSPLTW